MNNSVSAVIPLHNEDENVREVYERTRDALLTSSHDFEIIFVDDGSKDSTYIILAQLAEEDQRVKVIRFTRNFGQTAALSAGIKMASKQITITLDGDLQNDPTDIPMLINKLNEGFEVVCGWRKKRKDHLFSRKIPSILANKLVSCFSGVHLNDFGCTLKAFKTKTIQAVHLYGDMHRYVSALVARDGGRVVEVEVKHHPRTRGQSKYGMERTVKVILDLFVLKFLSGSSTYPIYFFGKFGIASILIGSVVGLYATISRFFFNLPGINLVPLLLFSMLFIIIGVQTILIGLLADIGVRTYYESLKKPIYIIDHTINLK